MNMDESKPSRVVVGIDFSQSSVAAAKWVVHLLPSDAELVLVHALVVPEMGGILSERFPLPKSLLINARAGAERRLKELSPSLGGDRIWLEVREGRPGDVIAEVARDYDAQMVVVGKHGEGGTLRGYTGRTADRLVRTSPVPVLLASGMLDSTPRRVIVPLTFSSITPFIIDRVKALWDTCDPEILVLHVVGSAVLSHVLSMSAVAQGKEPMTRAEVDQIFASERGQWKNALVGAGIPAERVKSEVVFGEVSQAVLVEAKEHDADMIVMGSHAGPVRRALLGSAASAVLRHAEIPVLVVVEPEESEPRLVPAMISDLYEQRLPAMAAQ